MSLAEQLHKRKKQIRAHLAKGAVDVLCFLQQRFDQCDPSTDRLFQFAFIHFYQLDNAKLTNKFFSTYFEILRDNKKGTTEPAAFAKKLYRIANTKGQKSLQISFVSKLCATIDPTHPIYDKHVTSFYGLPKRHTSQGFDRRIAGFLDDFATIRTKATEILANQDIKAMIADVRTSFPLATCSLIPDMRVIDLLVYAHGASQ